MELSKLSDEKLASFMQENGGDGIEEIIDRYQKKLERYVLLITRDSEEANDVLQEVFISVYKNINSFDLTRKFSSWIYRIAHNKALNELRKKKILVGLSEIKEMVDEDNNAEKIEKDIDSDDIKKKLKKNVEKMSIKYREVIMLRYFEDKSYEEISDILEIPKNTVGVRVKRGLEILKRKLNINVEDYL